MDERNRNQSGAVYTDENDSCTLDCRSAVWSTDRIHDAYHHAGIQLSDADWVVEMDDTLLVVEYENATSPRASKPGEFHPESERVVRRIARKYAGTLFYLLLNNRTKPRRFVYVVEGPKVDRTMRKRIRNDIHAEIKRIFHCLDTVRPAGEITEVLSAAEWNRHAIYGQYPLTLHSGGT